MHRTPLRSLPPALLMFLGLLGLGLAPACERGAGTDAPLTGSAGEHEDAASAAAQETLAALTPPSVELGAPDPELDPLEQVQAVDYELPRPSRRTLIGRAGSGAKLPEKLGRGGKLMVAIDSPYQLFARDTTYVHVAAWKPNGRPAAGASVFVGKREVGRTDRSGTLVFRHDQGGIDEDSYDDQSLRVVDSSGRCGAVDFTPYQRTPSFASDELFIYSDRGIYRPGDTLHVRGLGWRLSDDYAPLADAQIEVTLRDSRGHTIAGASPKSDADGVLSLDLELPPTAAEGLYELHVAYGQARALGRVQVRNFEVPAISITHDLGRFVTRDADELAFTLELGLLAGGELGATTLELAALGPASELLFERSVELSGPGPHALALSNEELAALVAGVGEDQFGSLRLRVSDDSGRRDEVQRELRVTQNPYVAVLELDKDQYATGEPVSIAARITDRDRVPTRDTAVSVELLASDGSKKILSARTDQQGTATLEFPMPDKGGSVALHLPDIDAPIAEAQLPWIANRPMQSKLDQLVVSEGQTAKLVVRFPSGFRPTDGWVHVDVVDTSGALVNATLLSASKEQGEWVARGEFTAPTWGSMLLTLFALGEREGGKPGRGEYGLLTEGQNLVVHPDKQLEITLEGFAEQAAPGETLSVRARVRNPDGELVDAAVGAALVDASVLDLKDPLEITPMDRFYNPQLRTLSTTGSKILTWPVVSRNWGGGQMDVALPPFPYMDGGSINACASSSLGGYGVVMGMGMGGGGSAAGMGLSGEVAGSAAPTKKSAKPSSSSTQALYDFDDDSIDGELAVPTESSLMPPPPPAAQPEPESDAQGGTAQGPRSSQRAELMRSTKITVRTRLPETSMWAPGLRAQGGTLELRATLPESIGEQELILVASDAQGGVGVHRERVRVTQPVHVRADLPARLIVGESLALPVVVANATDARHDFLVELSGLGSAQSATLGVARGERGVLAFPLSATSPGRAALKVRAKGGGHDDSELRELPVMGAGVPVSTLQHGTLSSKAPLRFEFGFADTANDASLRVRFPTLSAAFLQLDQLGTTLRDDPDAVAVDLVSTSLVLAWAKRNQQTSPALERLRERALGDISLLRLFQHPNGAYGYWRNGEPSPFVTGWALEGLLEARAAGLPEASHAIRMAAEYLAVASHSGLVDVADVGWWEGSTEDVRLGLTAELYAVLARVPKQLRNPVVETTLASLDKRFLDYIEQDELDPLAAGRAVAGLSARGKIDFKRGREIVRRLLKSRDQDHWEPSWFHAYGGRLEVSAALVELMFAIDPSGFDSEIRDTLAWVLSTREAWGSWHNERGTSAALRALLRTGGAQEEVPAEVEVWVDGSLRETVTIDPDDPYLSSLPLAELGLGQSLSAGKHAVELRYDGALRPSVELETRSWQRGNSAKASQSKGGNASLRVRSSASKLGAGAKLHMRVSCTGPRGAGGTLVVAASNLVEVDLGRLAAWVGPGHALRGARLVEGRVELELSPHAEDFSFDLPLRALRSGSGPLPSVAWIPRSGSKAAAMVVNPGELQVD